MKNAKTLMALRHKSLGRVHSILKQVGNMYVKLHEIVYEYYVGHTVNYLSDGSAITSISPNRIIRFFFHLGARRYASMAATEIKMYWLECSERRWFTILRTYRYMIIMGRSGLSQTVKDWNVGSETHYSKTRFLYKVIWGINIRLKDSLQ